MRRNLGLGAFVHILCAVEAWGSARADAICPQGLNRLLFERFIGDKVVVVVGSEIGNGFATGKLGLGAGWSVPKD